MSCIEFQARDLTPVQWLEAQVAITELHRQASICLQDLFHHSLFTLFFSRNSNEIVLERCNNNLIGAIYTLKCDAPYRQTASNSNNCNIAAT